MSLTLLHGPAGSSKTEELLKLISSRLLEDDTYIIVPNLGVADAYQQALVTMGRNIVLGQFIGTFNDFLFKTLKANLSRLHKASAQMSRNILRSIISSDRFHDWSVQDLAQLFIQIKSHNIAVDHVAEFSELRPLFEQYNATLQKLHYADNGDLLLRTLQLIKNGTLKVPEKNIIVDRVFPLHPGQRQLIFGLKEIGVNITISYSFDYTAKDDRFFYPAYDELGGMADSQTYFAPQSKTPIHSHQFHHPALEVEWVTKQITHLKGTTDLSRIAIITPTASRYGRLLKSAFVKEQIPLNSRDEFTHTAKTTPLQLLNTINSNAVPSHYHPTLFQQLNCASQISEFEEEWTFEKNMLFGHLTDISLLDSWKNEEMSLLRPKHINKRFAVQHLSLEQAYALNWDTVFILGFTQSNYPQIREPHSSFSIDFLGNPAWSEILEHPSYQYGLQKNFLDQTIARTKREIHLTLPQFQWDGRETLPSLLKDSAHYHVTPSETRPHSDQSPQIYPKIKKNRFSASEIETYLKCPYQYYARHYLNLGEMETVEQDIPADRKGLLIHRVLEQLLYDNETLYHEAIEYDLYLTRLLEKIPPLVENEEASLKEDLTLPTALIESFCKKATVVIQEYLKREIQLLRQKIKITKPRLREWAFGRGNIPPLKLTHSEGTFFISGRIDRVDIDTPSKLFSIIDYKTGDIGTGTSIRQAQSLQIPLYMMAVQQLLYPDYKPSSGLLISFKDLSKKCGITIQDEAEEKILHSSMKYSPEDWEQLTKDVTDKIAQISRDLKQGKLAPNPREKSLCDVCDYKKICHYSLPDTDASSTSNVGAPN